MPRSLSFQRKRHYWKLDTRSVVMYQNENSTRYYKVSPDIRSTVFCDLQSGG